MYYLFNIIETHKILGAAGGVYMKSKVVCKKIGQTGMFIYYDEDAELTEDNIKRCLTGDRIFKCTIEAKNPKEAIKKFFIEWEGANIGDEEELKARRIDRKKEIIEIPNCSKLNISSENRFICGEEVDEYGNGEFGGCVIDNCDPPGFPCPIENFYKLLHKDRSIFEIQTVNVNNLDYKVLRTKTMEFIPPVEEY